MFLSTTITIFTVMAISRVVDNHSLDDVERLHGFLFNTSRYNKQIRPSYNQSNPTQVNVSLGMWSIDEIDATVGNIVAQAYLYITWQDDLLIWNPAMYQGITNISLPDGSFWKPNLLLSSAKGNDDTGIGQLYLSAWLSNDGEIKMLARTYLRSRCSTDTFLYPYDTQLCTFYFMGTNYDSNELVIHAAVDKIDVTSIGEHQEWRIIKTFAKDVTVHLAGISLSLLNCTLTVKRRPEFIVIHNFLPITSLQFLCMITCFVHVDSGERLTFSITVFLSFIFLGDAIIGDLPRNSLRLSITSMTLLFGAIATTVGVIWSVFVVRVSKLRPKQNRIPILLEMLVLRLRKKCAKKSSPTRIKVQAVDNEINIKHHEITKSIDQPASEKHDNDKENIFIKENDILWIEVAETLDKIYFAVLCLCYILFNTVGLGFMVAYGVFD